jgi:two-component system, NtrC family, sensor kinase
VPESRAPGLRLQILLALGVLMVLAFVPLFFAVASLARATLSGVRERAARIEARVIAAHVIDSGPDRAAMESAAREHVTRDGAEEVRVFDSDGALLASAAASVHDARSVEVTVPRGSRSVLVRMRVEEEAARAAPLVGLVALYMTTFALALVTFAYFALTRLIVKPIDGLVRAADRVASGARSLRVPRAGARELAELGASMQTMTAHLIAEEEKLKAKVEELTQTTKRLTEARAMVVRSERLASVGRMAAGVAHEIGNPIAALMGMEDLLSAGDLPLETQRDFLERMRKETERIHQVVRDLLDFARPEQARPSGSLQAASASVRKVVDDVCALVAPQKPFKTVELIVDVDESLRVALPASRLTQVLLNLVLNAGTAVADAGREGSVTIRARRGEGLVRIEVEDTGPGIAEEVRERLFEPFVTTKDVGSGTGLGLAVCRGLVEAAGGEIGLDAGHGPGARFYVLLPQPDDLAA